ncbi:MAG: hypothetical protein WCC00_13985 [Candidatus Aminicenantales bacterium]
MASLSIVVQPTLFGARIKSIQLKEVLSIGSPADDMIFFVTSVTTDEKGFIYLTDSLDYSVKKFDDKGFLIKKSGRKGQGPGEFMYPVLIEYSQGMVYVADQTMLGIQVFDGDLNFKTHLPLNFLLFDLKASLDNSLYGLSFFLAGDPPISRIYTDETKNISPAKLSLGGELLFRSGKFDIDGEGNIYFAASFEDKIEKYDKYLKRIWKKNLFGGKKAPTNSDPRLGSLKNIPTEMIYKELALDRTGRLFILGGTGAEHRSRDVYVLDPDGNYLTTIVLPEPTHLIHIDQKGFFYSRAGEGTTLKKYALDYVFE